MWTLHQVSDCDMVIAYDGDLVAVDRLGHDSVSGLLDSSFIALLMLLVTGNPQTGRDDGSPPAVQHRDT